MKSIEKKLVALTVHDSVDLIDRRENQGMLAHAAVDKMKPSSTQGRQGHDVSQAEALLTVTFTELPTAREGDEHLRRRLLLSLDLAAQPVLIPLMPVHGEHCQNSPGPQREIVECHLGLAGEGEGEA